VSAPGLLGGGAAATYGYPMANGLLASMSAPQSGGTNWTNVALGLAGNPHAGPYATSAGALPSGYGGASGVAGQSGSAGTSGGSNLGTDAVGLLGALAKNPSLVKDGVSAVQSLLGSGSVPTGVAGTSIGGAGLPTGLTAAQQSGLLSSFSAPAVTGSLADSMGLTAGSLAPLSASALAPVGTGAITAAGNAAGASAASELGSALGTQAAPAAASATAPAAASAAAPAASAAGTYGSLGLLGAAGALAGLGYMGYGATHGPANNGWSNSAMEGLVNSVSSATKSGLLTPNDGITGTAGSINPFNANGSINQPLMSAIQQLQQLQLGDFGPATQSYIKPNLNALGYQNIQQAAQGKQLVGGGSSAGATSLRKRF